MRVCRIANGPPVNGVSGNLTRMAFTILFCVLMSQGAVCEEQWPIRGAIQIGAQFHDFQNYSKVPYLHGGLDMRAPAGSVVYTPVSGTITISSYKIEASLIPLKFVYVRTPFKPGTDLTSKYIEICIKTVDGTSWCFRHLDPGSIPYHLLAKAENREPLAAGDNIGNIVPWSESVLPVTEKYDHIHLEIIASDGSYLNPAELLQRAPDTLPPVIHGIWAVPNEETTVFSTPQNRPALRGDVDFVMAVTDSISGSRYVYSPYLVKAGLRSINGSATVVIPMADVYRFDRLPIKGDRTQLATVIYKERIKTPTGNIESNGSGGPRFFLMNLTNGNPSLGYKSEYALRTTDLPDGVYALDVEASDLGGNTASRTFEFTVNNHSR